MGHSTAFCVLRTLHLHNFAVLPSTLFHVEQVNIFFMAWPWSFEIITMRKNCFNKLYAIVDVLMFVLRTLGREMPIILESCSKLKVSESKQPSSSKFFNNIQISFLYIHNKLQKNQTKDKISASLQRHMVCVTDSTLRTLQFVHYTLQVQVPAEY